MNSVCIEHCAPLNEKGKCEQCEKAMAKFIDWAWNLPIQTDCVWRRIRGSAPSGT